MGITEEQNKVIREGITELLRGQKLFTKPRQIKKHQRRMINFLLEENYLGMNENEKHKVRASCSDMFYKFNQNKGNYITSILGVFCIIKYNAHDKSDDREELIMLQTPIGKMYACDISWV